ncbi:hypothetical protein TNCT6_60430 [Streptomyces sp. 6-11-2]|nr:hypothetical protein TNCT6_60430 [Streptomyces sp. 6-11-2]
MVHRLDPLVIRRTHRIPFPAGPVGDGGVAALQFDAALMSVGFKLSAELLERLSGLSVGGASFSPLLESSLLAFLATDSRPWAVPPYGGRPEAFRAVRAFIRAARPSRLSWSIVVHRRAGSYEPVSRRR